MKQIKIEKTDTGYILRLSFAQKMSTILLGVLMLSLGLFCFFIPWLSRDGATVWDFHTFFYLAMGLVGVGIGGFFLYISLGLSVVLDSVGVRRYRFGRCTFDMHWEHVKSWGITSVKANPKYKYKEQYYLYFSAVAGERTGKNCITMPISPEERLEILRADLSDYIAAHRSTEDDEDF